ncbi:MAG TPA: PDZ domain-containing protein [Candidatus Eisenbacteria bacterium]|nr:PDZ domain-containing protein [Candidatus Eisenbacteria bacterium]
MLWQLVHPVGRIFRGLLVCGFALTALTIASGARADDDDDEDWQKAKEDAEESIKDQDKGRNRDDDKRVRVFRWNEEETADQKGGYLGVQVQDITSALKKARDLSTDEGALVNRVEEESPADEAGIRRGDVIVSLNGKNIDDSGELIDAVRSLKPGKDVDVIVLRGDERKKFSVELGERPKNQIGIAPRFMPRWRDSERARTIPPPRARGGRVEGLQESLRDLHEQLRILRETEIPRLQEELRDLREELRRLNDEEGDRNDIRREGRRSRTPAED